MAPFYSKAYLTTQVHTSDRLDLVIALYEEALAAVRQTMEAIEGGDRTRRAEAVRRATNILIALSEALDHTQETDLSGTLFALYHFQIQQILEANRKNDIEPLMAVKGTLNILLSAWRQVARTAEAGAIREADAQQRDTAGARPYGTQAGQVSLKLIA